MHKHILTLLVLILFGCSNQPEQISNGLTKEASKITEYFINVEIDSTNNRVFDTLTIMNKFYNKHNQITKRVQSYHYKEDSMVIDYKYDIRNRLKKEIIKLIHDSIEFSVDYYYKSSLLYETRSEFENADFQLKQIGKYYYDKGNVLTKSSVLQQIIEFDINDTTLNQLEINNYNFKEEVTETSISDFVNPERNRKYIYGYDNDRLNEKSVYNHQDSLISKTLFTYELDKFHNWIEKRSFDNGELSFIKKREIKYK